MDIKTLRLFVEIAKHGSFAEAAKVVCATQSAVSKAMKGLESEMGVQLLARSGRGKGLTAAGNLLLRRAVNILHEMRGLEGELAEMQQVQRGSLRIGFPRMGTSAYYAGLFTEFRQRFPAIDVAMVVEPLDRLEAQLRAGEVDLAALVAPAAHDFDWQHVRTEPVVALVPQAFVPAGTTRISLADLAQWPLILFEEGTTVNQALLQACARQGVRPHVSVMGTGQVDFMVQLVAQQLGVMLLPRAITRWSKHPGVRYLDVDDLPSIWHFTLAWRRGVPHAPAARAWLDLARDYFQVRELGR
ncbi:LysR substrate-binding domain-containing protein [Acidovorax sp. BLS4]|uniref:LysR substrate-binding domain-containing protein n=1 Tax=Acidovorax sp. BLS4 TaxID=3273430 RepID=UPI0029433255|nr:LysR substrate-binding domain-containing protein [Paracidovorax avenae]WOI47778.1 LysR substrate-binding domain-containing protein [Paracidovorax avenae]